MPTTSTPFRATKLIILRVTHLIRVPEWLFPPNFALSVQGVVVTTSMHGVLVGAARASHNRWTVFFNGTSRSPRRRPVLPNGKATGGDEGAGTRTCNGCDGVCSQRELPPPPSPPGASRRHSNRGRRGVGPRVLAVLVRCGGVGRLRTPDAKSRARQRRRSNIACAT